MTKYLPIENAVVARQIVTLGATPGYVQLDDGKIVNLFDLSNLFQPSKTTTQSGDWLVDNGLMQLLLTQAEFEQLYYKPDLKSRLDNIEDLVESFVMQEHDSLTLCVMKLKSGRSVVGECQSYSSDMCVDGEAHAIAYGNALAKLMHLESHQIHNQLTKVAE